MTGPLDNIEGAAIGAPVICKRPRAGQFTDERSANFKRLIEMLRAGGVTRAQVAQSLGLDVNTASKYLADTGRAGATRFETRRIGGGGRDVTHRLSLNTEAVDCFIARLDAPRNPSPTRIRVSDDPTRHFHLIFSGAMVHPEPAAAPAADPLALPGGFFQPSQADDEPLPPRAKAAQVAPARFPVPSSYHFEIGSQP